MFSNWFKQISERSIQNFLAVLLIPAALTGLVRVIFFHYSTWIWSFAADRPVSDFVPWCRWQLSPRDGIELYVLLALALLVALLSGFLVDRFTRVKNGPIRLAVLLLSATATGLLFYWAGVVLPKSEASFGVPALVLAVLTVSLTAILWILGNQHRWLVVLSGGLVVAACFIPVVDISFLDYTHILGPAWKIANGLWLKETYSQYDYFPSLVVALWMKLGLDIGGIRILAQGSYFLLFIGIYFFARKFFVEKKLVFPFMISLLIIRMYACQDDPVMMLQSTPLRMDLWLPLLALAYWKGVRHWSVGAALAFLLVFHHTFGRIYVMSYGLLILAFFIVGIADQRMALTERLKQQAVFFGRNVILILLAMIIYNMFFKPDVIWGTDRFLKYGVGFVPILKRSFFWHIFTMFGVAAALLWQGRPSADHALSSGDATKDWSERRFQSAVFLLALAIGNSIYFFGRSVEYNIVNISPCLLLLTFYCVDMIRLRLLVMRFSTWGPRLIFITSLTFIAILSFAYAGRIFERVSAQFDNLQAGRFFCQRPPFFGKTIRDVTAGSDKVVVLSGYDFYYYYDAGYVPRGFYSYTLGWIFQNDLIGFLKSRLQDGYFIVVPINELPVFIDILDGIKTERIYRNDDFIIFTRNKLELVRP